METIKNIFDNLTETLNKEFFEELIATKNFKLERIISEGHASPPNFWYDQDKNEFVLLLKGKAILSYDNGNKFELNPGDYMIINAHQKHRVDWTLPKRKTFWLTLLY